MIVEIILAALLGLILGIITGLIPGLHTNLISAILISSIPFLSKFADPITLIIFVVVLNTTNLFFEIIPTVFLGVPDEDNVLSVQPGHALLLKGEGLKAIWCANTGKIYGVLISLILAPLFFIFLISIYPFFEKMMFFILIWISILIFLDNENKIMAFLLIYLSGFLGITTLNLNLNQPLLPMLTGLFGTSGLLYSIKQKAKIPEQKSVFEKINKKDFLKPTIVAILISPICSFLPGLGGAQATAIGSKLVKEVDREQFLFLNGAINSILMCLAFVTLFLIDKARTGSANTIAEISKITQKEVIMILGIIVIIGLISFYLAKLFSIEAIKIIEKINYTKLSVAIIVFLIILTSIISGGIGFLVLITSTFIGLTCQEIGIKKSNLMFCLLVPTIIIYWPF